MKKTGILWSSLALLLLCALFNATPFTRAQQQTSTPQQSIRGVREELSGSAGTAAKSATVNFATMAKEQEQGLLAPTGEAREKEIDKPKPGPRNRPVPPDVVTSGIDLPSSDESNMVSGWGDASTTSLSPAPSSSFKALDDNDTTIPPDTHGAVGPNHLMVTLNSQVRIQNRAGGVISTVSLDGFWSRLGNLEVFDPKVLYDPYNNRWMFTACANPESINSALLIGVSQTSDPTANWKLYKIDVDAANLVWADYPSIGFNKSWIVVTVNMFGVSDDHYQRENIYAFNKANLYAFGNATFKLFQDSNSFATTPAITYDNTLSTMYLVEDWNGNASDGKGYLRISTITGAVGAETLHTGVAFPSSSAWQSWVDSDFAPQLGSTERIQNNDSRIQNTVYRNGSLWSTHTAFLPTTGTPTRSVVQWWEMTPTGTVKQRGRIDGAASRTFYAFPSIAVNKNSDVLIGYSSFSSQQYAAANYSFRKSTDALNVMQTSVVLKKGESPYYKTFSGYENRWGDYSATVVDPLNDTDMWVIQEYAAVPVGDSMWGTWWGRVVPGTAPATTERYSISGRTLRPTPTGPVALGGVTIKLGGGSTASTVSDANGYYTIGNLPGGRSYTVTPSKTNYTFTPTSRTISGLSGNLTGINFSGKDSTVPTYTISGRITAGTAQQSVPGVYVKLTGSYTITTRTDTHGNYSFKSLPTGNYTVTPTDAYYSPFSPTSWTFTSLKANQTANFTASRQ